MTNYETTNLKNIIVGYEGKKMIYLDHFTVIMGDFKLENNNEFHETEVKDMLESFRIKNNLLTTEEYEAKMKENEEAIVKWECENKFLQCIYVKMMKCKISDFAKYGGAVNIPLFEKELKDLAFARGFKTSKRLYRNLDKEIDLVKSIIDYKINPYKDSEAILGRYKNKNERKQEISKNIVEEKLERQKQKDVQNDLLKDGRVRKIEERKESRDTQEYTNVKVACQY